MTITDRNGRLLRPGIPVTFGRPTRTGTVVTLTPIFVRVRGEGGRMYTSRPHRVRVVGEQGRAA